MEILYYTTGIETPNIRESGSTFSNLCRTHCEALAFERHRCGHNFLCRTVRKNGKIFRQYFDDMTEKWV